MRVNWKLSGLLALAGVGLACWFGLRGGRNVPQSSSPATALGVGASRASYVSLPVGERPVVSTLADAAPTPITEFNGWLEEYRAAPTDTARAALLSEGESLISQRRGHLRELIRTNPEAALAAAVPMTVRAQLPERLRARLEERVSGRGFLGVLIGTDFERGAGEVRREMMVNGRRYEAFVYGRRLEQGTRKNLPFHGIAVGDQLAVHENPVRPFEAGEPLPADGGIVNCPVSGRPADAFGTPAAAEVAGAVERYCGAGHINLRNDRLAADEGDGGNGGDEPPIAADSWTQGPKTCLFMRVAFPDDPSEPITEDGAYALMDAVNQWFVENSYGTASIIPTVTPLLLLPQPKAWYGQNGTGVLLADSRDAARAAGYDTDNFNWDIVRHGSISGTGFGYGGLAYVRGKGVWLQSSSTGVAVHELGHNYGLWHANYWTATGDSVIGPGSNSEYGNSFDTMGAASAGANQFNAAFKSQIDWLPDSFVTTAQTSGTYRVFTFDVPRLVAGQPYALKVRKDYDRNYWLEFRQKFTSKPWLMNGVLLNWDPWNNGVAGSASGTHLLDTMPGTTPGKDDGAVIIGRTFSDWAAGLHFTPVARGGASPDHWIDVVLNFGVFPTNRPPSLVITADRSSADTNSAINFIASATDPDGDALAYWWNFGEDSFGPNAPFAAKSWSSNAEYTVRCTVSDMKGGTVSRQLLVSIGTTTNAFRASGRVTTDNGEPLEGVRIHNGASASAYRGTYTDSDGFYTLPNLAGSNSVSAVKYGFALTRNGWSSPLVFGSNASGLNWTAVAAPVVGVTALTPVLNENPGSIGVVRFTRTGPTNAPLLLKFNRTGSATFGGDYTLAPAPTNTPLQLAIPAGAASLDVTVTPFADTSGEGPEVLRLTLIEDAAYVLGSMAEAGVTIADDDTVGRPNVSVSATSASADNLAPESGQDLGVFTFTRSGAGVLDELVIYYTVSGTAAPGVDYTALAGVAAIPDGETSTTIPFTVLDDSDVETNESVVVTLASNAAYNISGSPATVTIVDDDPTTVTIIASDNTAREGGGNNAAFTVTRQGGLAANFTVGYAVSGTASNGVDCVLLSGTVTILAGRATATITVAPVNDAAVEGPETMTCALLASPTCNVGNPSSASVTILDDELPTITLGVPDATASEPGTGTGAFLFARAGATNDSLTVFFTVTGTATPGADYVPLGDRIVIPAGSSNATLVVTALDDAFAESPERILVAIATDAAYGIGTATPQLVTLRDDDGGAAVAVGFSGTASSGAENVTFVEISVGLSTNAGSTVTVEYAVTDGTAVDGSDFYSVTGRLSFASGAVNQTAYITLINDTNREPSETVVVTLFNPTNAVLDASSQHTYTILDDDDSGVITVSAPDASAAESGLDSAVFRVTRAYTSTNAQTVFFQVAGTASSPADFVPIGRTVVIPAGLNAVDVVITPVDDNTPETNETVILNLTSAPGGTIGAPDFATVRIQDNDTDSTLAVVTVTAPDALASEPSADTAMFTFARDRGTNAPLIVTFGVGGAATSGTDFTALGTTVTIPVGAYQASLVLTSRNDSTFETNETVVVTLTVNGTYRVGSPASATAVIADDEAGVSITASGATDEENNVTGWFTFTRSGSFVSNLTVNFATAGTAGMNDYVSPGTNVVIPAGTNSVVLPLVAVDDAEAEGNEAVVLTLQPGPGYAAISPTNAVVFLLDDEAAISIAATVATAYEAGGPSGVFTLTRAGNTNFPLTVYFTVSGTADDGVDYAALSNSVLFPEGEDAVQVQVVPLNDAAIEGGETVQLTVTPHVTYQILTPNSAQVTIIDDESNLRPVVSITSPIPDTVHLTGADSMLVLEAAASDDGQPNPPAALSLAWSQLSGPALISFGGTNAAHTTARFPAHGAYVLRVTANDGELSAFADRLVEVNPLTAPPTNTAPLVEAGLPQSLPVGTLAFLAGVVTDDHLPAPPGAVTSWWSQVSGPDGVVFTEVSDPQTTATFPGGGNYLLRLTAFDGEVATADDVAVTVIAPPLVSIQAVGKTASEFAGVSTGGEAFGTFNVSRAGDGSSALVVRLAIGGTASNGVDYSFLTNVVVLNPGEFATSLFVDPIRDALAEGEETVTISILPDPAYIVGAPGADTVVIGDLPWDNWRFSRFSAAELDDPLISGENADPDADRLRNLLEYAFNFEPRSADTENGFRAAIENIGGPAGGGQPAFVATFKRRLAPRDLRYEVEVSTDLVNWISGPNATRELFPPLDDGNGVTETVRVQILGFSPQTSQRFVRLKVTRL